MTKRKKPVQPLLGTVAPDRKPSTFEDRGFGTTETPDRRRWRLARERALHETRKYADATEVLSHVKLGRMK